MRKVYNVEGKLPDRIENAPELLPGLNIYLEAFFDLDRERPMGFGMGYIPRATVRDYAKDYGFDEDQTHMLHYSIRMMDSSVMEIRNRKQKDATPAPRRTLTGSRRK